MTAPASPPHTVAVIGAGIAGLAAAYRLHRLLPATGIVVLDADDRVGGKIRTTPFAGRAAVDCGADAFLARSPAAVGLARELGLADQLVTPAERSAFLLRAGTLHRFPPGLVLGVPTDLDALAASGLVSDAGVERARSDLDLPDNRPALPEEAHGDESVGSLVRRRVGDEVFETLVAPLLSGVNGGDADRLSAAAGAPQLAAAVADPDQPSLVAGLRAQAEAARAANPDPEAPVFYALRGGSQTLTDALAAALPAGSVRLASPVTALAPAAGGGYELTTPTGTVTADAVVVALPSFAAAELLAPHVPATADGLAGLEWAPAALVTLAARRDEIDHPLDGSGFLVPEAEGLLLTACSFGSTKWSHWAAQDTVVLRAGAGRHHDRRFLDLDDADLVHALADDLAAIIGWRGAPTAWRIASWERALPQYRPGHLVRAAAWKDQIRTALPGVEVCGASYFGLGIPACIVDADETAARIAGTAHHDPGAGADRVSP